MLIKTKLWLGGAIILVILIFLASLNIVMHKNILVSLDARDQVRGTLHNAEEYKKWRQDVDAFVTKMVSQNAVPAMPRNFLLLPYDQQTAETDEFIESVKNLIKLVDQYESAVKSNERLFEEHRSNIISLYKKLDHKIATVLAQLQMREVLGEDVSNESSLAPYVLKSLNQLTLIALNSLVTRQYPDENKKTVKFNHRFLDMQLKIIDSDGSIAALFKKLFIQIDSIQKLILASSANELKLSAQIGEAKKNYDRAYLLSSQEYRLHRAQSRVEKADHNLQLISSRTLLLTSVFLILVPLLVIGLALLGVNRLIFLPVKNLVKIIRKFEKGDLLAIAKIRSDDEIGMLSSAFNKMAEQIRQKVSDLDLLNRELGESEEKYRLLAINSEDVIFTLNKDLQFTYISPSINRLRGSKESDYIGKKFSDKVPAEALDEVMKITKQLQKRIKTGSNNNSGIKRFLLKLKGKNGKSFWVEITMSLMYGKGKKVFGLLGVARDITDRVRAEEKLKTSLGEKEILLREVLHRTKNNMGVISSFLELQSASYKSEEVKHLVNDSTARIKTMALAHEMLYNGKDISKINMRDYITGLMELLEKSNRFESDRVS
ncbi:MAG TPA: histidine kinase dimerization/phosphoacceptor domain -containing protein, partial [Spirochaetota bacterium]|nr:histidine kinase dimerization/phosphoacceptor domain -containing protein [Spirochaetota bacterium]